MSQQSHLSIGIPIPDITPMNPPLGLVPPLPPKIEHLSRHRAIFTPGLAHDEGPGLRGAAQRLGVRQRHARRGDATAAC